MIVDQSQAVRDALASWFDRDSPLRVAESCVLHAFDRTVGVNSGDYRSLLEDFRVGFPDVAWRIRMVLTDGKWSTAHADLVGTHLGHWHELEPTGRRVEWEHMLLFRFDRDVIAEVWEVFDPTQISTQLGGAP